MKKEKRTKIKHLKKKKQNLEFVAETRILTEMKIENRGTKYFPWGNN